MKNNGSRLNRYDLIAPETSADSEYCPSVTSIRSDRLKELELKRDILTTAKAMIDTLMSDALAKPAEGIASPESDIVFGRSGSRASLFKAIDETRKRLIIVCPWLSLRSIDDELLLKFIALLTQGIRIDIGWGYKYDIGKIISITGDCRPTITADAWQNYSALPTLHKLQANYPNLFHLRLMGTHAKYWICDRKFAYVGSHNVLSSNTSYLDLAGDEVGTLHTSPHNIQKLINSFETQPDLSR
jgi:phosphatidylserine/phosphatidylglycerophosphate/cardiolipin synthase-like enzyme